MSISYVPSLPPIPSGLTPASMTTLRAWADSEEVLQILFNYIQNQGTGVFNVKAYGAKGDGSTDDTTALLAAIAACIAAGGGCVFIPPGDYVLSDELVIADSYGVTVQGSSRALPTLRWRGTSTGKVIFKLKNTQHTTIQSLQIISDRRDGTRPEAAIESISDTTYSRTYAPTAMTYRDLLIGTGTANEFNYGLKWTNIGTDSDTNNSEGMIDSVKVQGAVEASFYIGHAQSKAHHFIGTCGANGGKYGVYQLNGSFTWHSGNISSMSIAAFYVQSANDTVLCTGVTSEGCARLLEATPSGNAWPITLMNCRFAADAVNSDKYAVKVGSKGPVRIVGCLFDSAACKIATNWQTTGGRITVEDCEFGWTSSDAATVFVDINLDGVWRIAGNAYLDGSGAASFRDVELITSTATKHGSSVALFELSSTTMGFLPPRMTTTQRDAISSPPEGLVIYNTTTHKLNVYTTAWEQVTSA